MLRSMILIAAALAASCQDRAPPSGDGRPADGSANASADSPSARDGSEAAPPEPTKPGDSPRDVTAVGACRLQDDQVLAAIALKAIGTEPFWGARIDGRCVTYSHPDDQDGTRIWTRFSGSPDSGVWTGFYDNQRFELRTRPQPGCSDGMSDNRYPIAVDLTVVGEKRTGCAQPL